MIDPKLIDEGMWTRGTECQQKSWKFPKLHLLSHAFSGISEKGVTANYNTKLNEHEHRETRIMFESGNQKDVAAQAISLLPSNSFCYAHFFLDHQAQSVCGSTWHAWLWKIFFDIKILWPHHRDQLHSQGLHLHHWGPQKDKMLLHQSLSMREQVVPYFTAFLPNSNYTFHLFFWHFPYLWTYFWYAKQVISWFCSWLVM